MSNNHLQRRRFVKSAAFGLIGITTFGTTSAGENKNSIVKPGNADLQVARKGSAGRKLNKTGDNIFSPAGAASVKIIFKFND